MKLCPWCGGRRHPSRCMAYWAAHPEEYQERWGRAPRELNGISRRQLRRIAPPPPAAMHRTYGRTKDWHRAAREAANGLVHEFMNGGDMAAWQMKLRQLLDEEK